VIGGRQPERKGNAREKGKRGKKKGGGETNLHKKGKNNTTISNRLGARGQKLTRRKKKVGWEGKCDITIMGIWEIWQMRNGEKRGVLYVYEP